MPGIPPSTEGIKPLRDALDGLRKDLSALQTQQTQVVTDPSGATGDPAHGHATLVIGNLLPITGIAAFGEAVWSQALGSWVQVTSYPEALHVVGAAGEPGPANGWVNFDAVGPTQRAAAFYKDRGRVYLQGLVKSGTIGLAAFTLPPGYLPATADVEFLALSNGGLGVLQVTLAGAVIPAGGSNVSFFLDGHSFRAA